LVGSDESGKGAHSHDAELHVAGPVTVAGCKAVVDDVVWKIVPQGWINGSITTEVLGIAMVDSCNVIDARALNRGSVRNDCGGSEGEERERED
jgi:hypothetical protein